MKREGSCEMCDEYGIIFLNGERLLCWEHYTQLHEDYRSKLELEKIAAGAEKLRQEYADAISVVTQKAKAKHKGEPEDGLDETADSPAKRGSRDDG